MRKIYFAHPIYTYLQPDETTAREILEGLIDPQKDKIICPREDLMEVFTTRNLQALTGQQIMERCLRYVKGRADVVVVLSILKYLPKGCYEEILAAFEAGKPVIAIVKEAKAYIICELNPDMVVINDPTNWKYYYGRIKPEIFSMTKTGVVYFGALGQEFTVLKEECIPAFEKEKAKV